MTAMEPKELLDDLKRHENFIIGLRRELHRIPELGFDERETSALICKTLSSLNIEYSHRDTAITAVIRGRSEKPCVGLRADIDGLPISEETGLSFSSINPGKMHACGHDGHTAILLGATKWFSDNRDKLNGTVKLFFQPAEESGGGAEGMIKNGDLENPSVSKVFGLHLMPSIRSGFVEVKKGILNGCSSNISIDINGILGHGAYPETAVDAVMVAAQVVSGVHTLVSRRVSPLDQAVISFGVIEGGKAQNIIADRVSIRGTMRTTDEKVRDHLIVLLKDLVKHTSAAHGAVGEVEISHGYPSLINNNEETERVAKVAEQILGKEAVLWKEQPSLGVEDFSFFLKERPGAFYHLGCGFGEGRECHLHSSDFLLNEDCLIIGSAMQAALVLDVFANGCLPPKGDNYETTL